MSGATFFVQPCPTCGRLIQVRVNLLGKPVRCLHCMAEFSAEDPDNPQQQPDPQQALMQRVNALLEVGPEQLAVRQL